MITEPIKKHYDVIIVGGGLSGLTSAVKILQKEPSLELKILEMSNKVGGQLDEVHLGEMGAKWISENQTHMVKLLKDFDVPVRKRVILAPECKACSDMNVGISSSFARFELGRYINELELRVHYYKPGRYDMDFEYETMQQHIHNRLFFNKSRKYMINLVQLISGTKAEIIHYDEFMRICYANGSLRSLMDLYWEFPPAILLEFSSSQLMNSMLNQLSNVEIECMRTVHTIYHYKEFVEVFDSEKERHTADVLILAIPWNCVEQIHMSPAIPAQLIKSQQGENSEKLLITTIFAKYTEAYWRKRHLSGQLLSIEPFVIGHEYRPLTYFGLCVHDEGFEPLVRSLTLQTLSEYFGPEMLYPVEYHQETFKISSMLNPPLTKPWNRIVWSSSSTAATTFRGCLGGAVQSGLKAAMHALMVVRPQTVNWRDIAEVELITNAPKRNANYLSMWISTWNLYNTTYYSLVVYVVVTGLRTLYRYRYNKS